MANILLDAHGDWDPGSKPAYALVPKGSRLLYFSENLKVFLNSDEAREKLMSTEPSQVVEGFKWAQNFTVSPLEDDDDDSSIIPTGMEQMTVSGDTLLCTSDQCGNRGFHDAAVCQGVFADPRCQSSDIYFVACRVVKLKETGTTEYYAQTGVNQDQQSLGYQEGGAIEYGLTPEAVQEEHYEKLEEFFDNNDRDGARVWLSATITTLTDDQVEKVIVAAEERYGDEHADDSDSDSDDDEDEE
jgi:hypothetical protein